MTAQPAADRPLGPAVTGFAPPPAPGPDRIAGRFVTLERLSPAEHAAPLFDENRVDDSVWDYLGYGPFADPASYRQWQERMAASADPFFYALRGNADGRVAGLASFLRIDTANGVIEIGHIEISPGFQRTPVASEGIMLMIRWAFETGYRRVEWKCDALNGPSRRAAARYGFTFEGVFRKHMIYKGRNRDTAWFAITEDEWPRLRGAYDRWLSPENIGPDGAQKTPLSAMTSAVS